MFAIENQQNRSITSGRKSGPRLRKIAFLVFKPVSEVPGSNPGGDKNFFNLIFLVVFSDDSYYTKKNKIWKMTEYIINTLVFLFQLVMMFL